jgi:hypothetical protein
VLFSLPTAFGLASASILASFGEDLSVPTAFSTKSCGENLLFAAVAAAALCRAFRRAKCWGTCGEVGFLRMMASNDFQCVIKFNYDIYIYI